MSTLIDQAVQRFLGWRLPDDFSPAAGISFKADYNEGTAWPMKHEPTGTNLFNATQARAMFEYCLQAAQPAPEVPSRDPDEQQAEVPTVWAAAREMQRAAFDAGRQAGLEEARAMVRKFVFHSGDADKLASAIDAAREGDKL